MEIGTDWLCRPSTEDEGGLGLSEKAYLEMASCEEILDSTCVGSKEIKIASKSRQPLQPKCSGREQAGVELQFFVCNAVWILLLAK